MKTGTMSYLYFSNGVVVYTLYINNNSPSRSFVMFVISPPLFIYLLFLLFFFFNLKIKKFMTPALRNEKLLKRRKPWTWQGHSRYMNVYWSYHYLVIHNKMATDEMKSKLDGKWKLYKNENIDAFFSDVGKCVFVCW